MILAATFGDAAGHLLGKLRAHMPALARLFDGFALVALTGTRRERLDLLRSCGATIELVEAEGLVDLQNDEYARGADAHERDLDPRRWANRMRIAYQQTQAMARYMPDVTPDGPA